MENEEQVTGSGRRDFLKKSLLAGAVVWSAPVVTSLPSARTWAATYGCPNPAGPCTVNSYGLQVTAPVVGTLTFPTSPGVSPNPNCIVGPLTIGSGASVVVISTGTLCGEILSDATGCTAHGYVEQLALRIGPRLSPLLTLSVAVADANATTVGDCPPCATTGASIITSLKVNGGTINVSSPCNSTINLAGLVFVHLNEQTCNGDTLSVNAVRVAVPTLGINVIAGHAEAGRTGCTCSPCV